MAPLSLRCIKAALLSLVVGIGLGVSFALDRRLGAQLRPLHVELNLWGWATLLIYGMAYHLFPRFSARPLAEPRLADAQGWLAIAGVALAGAGWAMSALGWSLARPLLVCGGLVELAAVLLFAGLIAPLLRVRTALG